ncbi:hypothetical protein SprV_0501828400 [Sparganum proliferum]
MDPSLSSAKLSCDQLVTADKPEMITSVSIVFDLAIETIELLLQSKYDETENRLGRAKVLQLLKFCLRTYFTFDGTIYEQVKGTPMGSPISGFIAEAVLQRLESLVFQHHKPKFWARYVDDTFVVIDRDQLLTFKKRLNTVFPDIQFTMEEEENNQLAFLDVLRGTVTARDSRGRQSSPRPTGTIQLTVTCGLDAATQATLTGQAMNKVRHIRGAVRRTFQSPKMGIRINYSKRRASNKILPVNASSSFDMSPGNRILTTIEVLKILFIKTGISFLDDIFVYKLDAATFVYTDELMYRIVDPEVDSIKLDWRFVTATEDQVEATIIFAADEDIQKGQLVVFPSSSSSSSSIITRTLRKAEF